MKFPLKYFALFSAVLAFLVLTVPANHSEAEDAYYYARMAEQGAWSEMFHAHHLLYLPLVRGVYRVMQFAGYDGRALPVLIAVSMVSGAFAVCLFSALLQSFGARRNIWPFAASLLFSYGFWRYSTTAEIYIPVTALSLLTLYCAVRSEEHPLFFISGILSGTCALLMHLASLPAVLLAVPFLLTFRQSYRRAAAYLLLTGVFAAAVYWLAVQSVGLTVFTDTQIVRDSLLAPRVWLRGIAAFAHNMLSANFLFSIPSAASRLQSLFPVQMLQEEIFMGQAAPRAVRWLAPVSLGASAAVFAAVLFAAMRNSRQAMAGNSVPVCVCALWLGGTAAMAFLFEPANPEMWICILPPFWLLLGLLWNRASNRPHLIPVLLAAALLLHNWIGGMSLVQNPDGDYCRQKGAWISEQVQSDDLIVTADSHSFVTFLEYQTPARVADAKFINPAQWAVLRSQTSGQIFIFSDVMELLPPVARRAPQSVRQIQEMAAQLQPGLYPVHQNPFGTVYQWKNL